jgi:hypothetical protein
MIFNMATETLLVTRTIPLEVLDKLTCASLKLDALLACTYGQNGESFRDNNDEIQDTYLWACSDLAQEIKTLAHQLSATTTPPQLMPNWPSAIRPATE